MAATKEHVPGNEESVQTLKQCLAAAEKGTVGYVVCVMVDNNSYSVGVSGNINLEALAEQGMQKALEEVIRPAQENRKCLPRDPELDDSYQVYNVAMGPASYDVIPWLIEGEMIRRKSGAPSPLKVHFWEGKDKSGAAADARKQMLNAVMKPAVSLIGGVLDDKAIKGLEHPLYTVKDIEKKAKAGEEVPLLKAPENSVKAIKQYLGKDERKIITLTLRETDEWNHRNSNVPEWIKFADYLEHKGYRVIIIRDTAKAFLEPLSSHQECPQASVNVLQRMALYEQAYANLMISNGPMNLCLFSKVPWLMFVRIEPDDSVYAPATYKFYRENFSIDLEKGEQHYWCSPKQRIVPADDTYDNLVKHFEEIIENG